MVEGSIFFLAEADTQVRIFLKSATPLGFQLTLLTIIIPKFGHCFLNIYTAYRLHYRAELGIEM